MQLQTILCVVPSIVFKPYVCKWYVYVCVCLLMIILKRVYHNLYVCTYVYVYVSRVSRFLFIRSSFVSLSSSVLFLGTLSDNQWKSMYFI